MSDTGLKFIGKDPNGYARAVSVDREGHLTPIGKSEVIVFSKDNPLAPRVASDYEPRAAGYSKAFFFPHLLTPSNAEGFSTGDYRNIFDQLFVIASTVNIELNVSFGIMYTTASSEVSIPIYQYTIGTIPASTSNRIQHLILTPEKSFYPTTGYNQIFELAELRQPVPAFRISISAKTNTDVPTSGDIKILNVRRY